MFENKADSRATYLVLGSEFGYEQLDLRTGHVTQHSSLKTGDLPQSDQDFWSYEEPQVSHRQGSTMKSLSKPSSELFYL